MVRIYAGSIRLGGGHEAVSLKDRDGIDPGLYGKKSKKTDKLADSGDRAWFQTGGHGAEIRLLGQVGAAALQTTKPQDGSASRTGIENSQNCGTRPRSKIRQGNHCRGRPRARHQPLTASQVPNQVGALRLKSPFINCRS